MTSTGQDSAAEERLRAGVLSGVPGPYQSQAVALWRETPLGLRLAYFQATALPE
jgi:hypothetical protein